MIIKLIEVRDDGTCIAAIAIRPAIPPAPYWITEPKAHEEWTAAHRFLLGKAGWWGPTDAILFGYLAGGEMHADPYDWPDNPRTMRAAHLYVEQHWATLESGAVVDARVMLGLATEHAPSDRLGRAV